MSKSPGPRFRPQFPSSSGRISRPRFWFVVTMSLAVSMAFDHV
jgi:uncharacterized membrane protein YhaH (DUF805 family)